MTRLRMRRLVDVLMRLLCGASTLLLGFLVVLVLVYVVHEGSSALNWGFFVHLPTPVGVPGGGMGNAIAGSVLMVALASAAGIPIGVACGVYLSEYGKGRFAGISRFLIEVLNGIPTIVFGVVAYTVVVVPMHTFSAYAGAAALAMIMIPLVARATELAVRQVPPSWREASVALGASPARTVRAVVLPGAKAGIVTGAMLAVARVAGETAPLLFTAFGNDVAWPWRPARATAGLPLQVFNYAMSPYDEWKAQAWAGALVLVLGILAMNILVRVFARTGADVSSRM